MIRNLLSQKFSLPSLLAGTGGTATVVDVQSLNPDSVKDLALFILLIYGIQVLGKREERLGVTLDRLGKKIDRLSLLILDTHQLNIESLGRPEDASSSDDRIKGLSEGYRRILSSLDQTRKMIEDDLEAP